LAKNRYFTKNRLKMHIELNFPERQQGDLAIETYHENGIRYQKLTRKGVNMMMNTPEIVDDFEAFLTIAEGSVLINGLGMGMCNVHLLQKETLKDLTVIEYDKSLVDFIAPLFEQEERCTIIHADAYKWEPPAGKYYDYVWHDVWTYQRISNLDDMETLFSKYKDIAGWQSAWRQEKCKQQAADEVARRKLLYGE
jgi:hypothetical protein